MIADRYTIVKYLDAKSTLNGFLCNACGSTYLYILYTGLVRFMGYGDLWGFALTVLIFYKSGLGFMGIYGSLLGDINPHKSP